MCQQGPVDVGFMSRLTIVLIGTLRVNCIIQLTLNYPSRQSVLGVVTHQMVACRGTLLL